MDMKKPIYLFIAAFTLTGCETLGLPGGSSANSCSNINWVRQNIKPGQTTHNEVIELCGQPTSSKQAGGSLQLNYVTTREADETTTSMVNAAGTFALSQFNILSTTSKNPALGQVAVRELSPVATNAGTYLPRRTEGVTIFVRNGKVSRIAANNSAR
ncbi:lipoprotein [Eikenella exigua]|uniref:Adhesin n=1 Tax=Eikenella exigua TaxID=2528037 RepID=A0AAX1F7S9_9NEIS|nr:lipoprotein [Eikenella exigua]QED92161.1 hypothetical protein EZJ17_05685 [Eikenella exigua]